MATKAEKVTAVSERLDAMYTDLQKDLNTIKSGKANAAAERRIRKACTSIPKILKELKSEVPA